MPRQATLPNVVPPLTPLQRAAETWLLAEEEAADLKERANRRKEEMIALARRMGEEFVKVRDEAGFLHTIAFETKAALRHSKLLDVKIVKADDTDPHKKA